MKTIYVHGLMAQHAPAFATGFRADVNTVREASQIIEANYPGFYNFVQAMPMEISIDQHLCHPRQLDMQRPLTGEIHFRPVEAGQGKVGMIILGVALIASAVFTFGTSLAAGASIGGALGGGLFGSGIAAGFGLTAGASFLVGGTLLAGALMSPATSDYGSREKPDARSSALINGTVNPQAEGQVVPICVGLDVMCEGTTIHRSLETENMIGTDEDDTAVVITPQPPEPPDELPPLPEDALIPGTHGGMGKSKKKKDGPVEGENTLQNKMVYREIRVLSEGIIGGLATGDEESIIVDGVPLSSRNSEGVLVRNVKGFRWAIRYGTADQAPYEGMTAIERSVDGWNGQEIKKGNLDPDVYEPPIYNISDSDVDAVKLLLQTAGAFQRQDDESGSTYGTKVELMVQTAPYGKSFADAAKVVFDGKSSSPYPKTIRVPKPDDSEFDIDPSNPNSSTWNVRVLRITPDTDSRYESDTINWSAVYEVIDHKMTNPRTATFMFEADSVSHPQIPKVVLRLTGISCEVPSNYDAETRTYNGMWDYGWKWAYTENPSFIVRTLLRHYCEPNIPSAYLDNTEFYLAGKWCDELVSDGEGGMEPRYTVNEYMGKEEDAIAWIQTLAATYNAQVWFGNSELHVTQDRPRIPVMPVHPGNIINGQLNRQSISVSEQITSCNVSYHDLSNDWKFSPEPYEDADEVARWKPNEKNITICTNRKGQAARMARYCVVTSKTEDEKITFRGGFHHALSFPGMILNVTDPKRMGVIQDGRIKESTKYSIMLDQTVTLDPDTNYTVWIVSEDGESLVEVPVLNSPGDTNVLQIEPLDYAPKPYYTWMLGGSGIIPEKFRVLSNRQVQDDQWEITALKYNPNKWTEVETGVVIQPERVSKLDTSTKLMPPTDPSIKMLMALDPQGNPTANLEITWKSSPSSFITEYRVSYRLNNSNAVELPTSRTNFATIQNAAEGIYEIRIVPVNVAGTTGDALVVSYEVEYGGASGLYPPADIATAQGGDTWTGQDLVLQLTANPLNTTDRGIVSHYLIEILNEDNTLRRTLPTMQPTSLTTTYTYAMNRADGLTSRIKVRATSVDAMGGKSNPIVQTIYNPAPELVALTNTDTDLTGYRIEHSVSSDPDWTGTVIWHSTEEDFVPTAENIAYQGSGTLHDVAAPQATALWVRYALTDSFGVKPISRLNISGAFQLSTADTEYPKPVQVENVAATPSIVGNSVRVLITYNAVENATGYDLEVVEDGGTAQIFTVTGNPHIFAARSDTPYTFRVRAKNVYIPGDWSEEVAATTPVVEGEYDQDIANLEGMFIDNSDAIAALDARLDDLETAIPGWADPTGATEKTTFATGTATLPEVAARLGQLILDLKAKGILNA